MIASNLPIITNKSEKVNIFWFRRDLRLEDNAGLYHALNGPHPVIPLFIFDQSILSALDDKHDRRVMFIHKSLQDIHEQLKKHGSGLFVLHGNVEKIWEILVSRLQIANVYVNHDYEPYAVRRDDKIRNLLGRFDIRFHTYKDQVIFEKDDILKADGAPYTVYTPYRRRWQENLTADALAPFASREKADGFFKTTHPALPTLESIGFRTTDLDVPAPEPDSERVRYYHEKRDYPALNATSRLSVHLRFGTVSIRKLVRIALELNETWLGELVWRDFFMMILYHFPYVVTRPFKPQYEAIKWRNHPDEFRAWCEGQTGYPIVDAGMRELNRTGFMHNRVRMITAGFLTKHLLIDWRKGERYFAKKLLDYDLAANNGNWQWAAGCGCDAAPYFRIFSPARQQEKFDPDYAYTRRWVPEYESSDYPKPVVDHATARDRALAAYSVVRSQP